MPLDHFRLKLACYASFKSKWGRTTISSDMDAVACLAFQSTKRKVQLLSAERRPDFYNHGTKPYVLSQYQN